MIPEKKKMIRVKQFCNEYQVGRTKAYQMIASGSIPHIRIGKTILIPVDALDRKIEQLLALRQDNY